LAIGNVMGYPNHLQNIEENMWVRIF